MEKLFANVLLKDEEIIKIYKPNRKKFTFKILLISLFFFLVSAVTLTSGIIFIRITIMPVIVAGVFFTIWLIILIIGMRAYHNIYYALTNKKLIIRRGVLGIDFLTLEYKNITLAQVYVSPLDKIFHTGSIIFASAAIPHIHGHQAGFTFSGINNPYQEFNFINETIQPK